ncbi:hypothetical protein M3J09_004843 [Ascochyta lentis]
MYHTAHESQIGPYAGTPLPSNPPTTIRVSFSFDSTNTASASIFLYTLHATANRSGLPISSVSRTMASGSARSTKLMMPAPYVASGERVDQTRRASWPAGRSSSEEREGPMPDPVVMMTTRL